MKNIHTFVVLAYKESKYLELCIQSVMNQTMPSDIVIATSTPNKFIKDIAKKYKLKIIENSSSKKGIGYDFNFALECSKNELITIAHQDDIYDNTYVEKILEAYQKSKKSLIIFPDYYEIKEEENVYSNKNLKIKRILLFPLRFRAISGWKFIKRKVLSMGCPICCPSVTFVTRNIPESPFSTTLKCDVDWYAWETLSKVPGKFIYIKQKLMGHRIHEESTTTEIINERVRTKEDLEMLEKFWPTFIAKKINHFYVKAEKNNTVGK